MHNQMSSKSFVSSNCSKASPFKYWIQFHSKCFRAKSHWHANICYWKVSWKSNRQLLGHGVIYLFQWK
jgi:hypothetical protein